MSDRSGLPSTTASSSGSVFIAFLKLGLTSFGGPIAHLGFFRDEFVERRKWLADQQYADLVAISQVLPGPTSSQVGFGIGLQRAGLLGAAAAFVGFTLPSAAFMIALAFGAHGLTGDLAGSFLAGLKVAAVAVVAHAVFAMARTLTPDFRRLVIAAVAAVLAILLSGFLGQFVALLVGALAGLVFCRHIPNDDKGVLRITLRPAVGAAALTLFVAFLVLPPVLAAVTRSESLDLFDSFYRAGTFVFGGGHVVLPLLQAEVVGSGWATTQELLTGYGTAQAVPRPLFTIAGYLGALSSVGPGGALGALIALGAIFLPGFLLLLAAMAFWDRLQRFKWIRPLISGVNAAVVGILAAALYSPVFTTAVTDLPTLGLALLCLLLLAFGKVPAWAVVLTGGLGSVGVSYLA